MKQKHLLPEVLVDLRRRLSTLAPRSPERRQVLRETADLYGVSEDTVYRALRARFRPRAAPGRSWPPSGHVPRRAGALL